MNKQKLIGKYGYLNHDCFRRVDTSEVLKDLKQLDEPQKVVVPKFVSDWIEDVKKNGVKFKNTYGFYEEIRPSDDVYRVMYYIFKESIAKRDVREWVSDNIDTFARAWLDGYEVDEEPKYQVSMKGIDTNFNFLNRHRNENCWIFSSKDKNTLYQTCHTRKELEDAGFGWVFSCEGIEIEEVEG